MYRETVRQLFYQAIELDPDAQDRFLERMDAPDEVRQAVRTLLRFDRESSTPVEAAIEQELHRPVGDGEEFGAYRLVAPLGRGGMGAVFLAERTDGEIRQSVAVKVVERGWFDADAYERFRQERQILAGLVHPNIARLLDGGTRADGVPYLVMEYVEGLPMDEYCRRHALDIAGRLRVFLPLCSAVEYAHRKLIIHRDLKPSNVLVTSDGEPKLLDFGVAKAIAPGAAVRNRTLILTPEYAGPEQVLGGEITTATDVYGLGAILYHLLLERPPHSIDDLSPAALQKAICEQEPARPSTVRPELAGDLENIVLKALRTDPAERYGSARELKEDLERFLDRRPVRATPASVSYRVRRFVRRHTLGTTAVLLALAAILAGSGTAVYQAHLARHRFEQVRELASRILFDIEKSIRDVPGTLVARQKMAETARTYLQVLADDAGTNPALQRDLAESYFQLSRIEFNTGGSAAALEDVRRCTEILRGTRDDCCDAPAQRLLFIRALADEARYIQDARDPGQAGRVIQEAVDRAGAWLAQSPGLEEAKLAAMAARSNQGIVLQGSGQATAARDAFQQAAQLGATLLQARPGDDELVYQQARCLYLLASLSEALLQPAEGVKSARTARSLLDTLLARRPENNRWQQLRVMTVNTLASLVQQQAGAGGSPATSREAMEAGVEAYKLAKENLDRNPGDRNWLDQFSVTAAITAAIFANQHRPADALVYAQEAGAAAARLLAGEPTRLRYRYLMAANREMLAGLYLRLERVPDAARTYREAEQLLSETLRTASGDFRLAQYLVSVRVGLSVVEQRAGHREAARRYYDQALADAAALVRKDAAVRQSLVSIEHFRSQAVALGVPGPETVLAEANKP